MRHPKQKAPKNRAFLAISAALFNSGAGDRNRCKPIKTFILESLIRTIERISTGFSTVSRPEHGIASGIA
jgi:hypothetical protein